MTKTPKQALPFHQDMVFEYGLLQPVGESVRRLVCHNPSSFTFKGTNTYVVGQGQVAVIDPGPVGGDSVEVLLRELKDETVTHILLTHCHSDHSGAVKALTARTNALVLGYPRAKDDPAFNAKGPSGGDFVTPVAFSQALENGSAIAGDGWTLEALHTPGHAPDHLCFWFREHNTLFSGDHVMGWNTSVIAPPEGHMGAYIASLEMLLARNETVYYPGHGGLVTEPQRLVKALIMHRRWRESEIAECLRQGLSTIDQVVPKIYGGIGQDLHGAAALAVLAQLELMVEKGLARMEGSGPLDRHRRFAPTERLAR